MHSSIFSYNLSRSYPFRWFTPVVIVGGILATILVSFLSVGTSGYQLVSISSADPNITESERTWFGRGLGSIFGSMQPSCVSTTIPLNTILYTNNSALPYTLAAVSTIGADNTLITQGSLVYHNNPLENCTISDVQIKFNNVERSANSIATQVQGASLYAHLGCTVEADQGVAMVNLTASYDYLPDDNNRQVMTFVGRNATTQASLYWGESLLLMYWIQLTDALITENRQREDGFYKGTAKFPMSSMALSETAHAKSLAYFSSPACYFVMLGDSGTDVIGGYCQDPTVAELAEGAYNGDLRNLTRPLPNIWIPADTLSKVLVSTVLADLGQVDSAPDNILANKDLLTYFTQNFTAINASLATDRPDGQNINLDLNLAYLPFSENDATKYDLRITPSTLATNYICQVPVLKPAGSLIVAVLIADLVLLQTIWRVFKLVTDHVLVKRYPELQYCEGCRQKDHTAIGLERISSPSGSSTKSLTSGGYEQLRS